MLFCRGELCNEHTQIMATAHLQWNNI